MAPAWLLTRWFQRRSQVFYRRQRTASARLIVQFVETMTGMRAVQAFRREAHTEREYGRYATAYRDANLDTFSLNGRYQPASS